MGAKLHELLAVESDAQGQYKLILAETAKVFKDGLHIFQGHVKSLTMFDDKDSNLNTVERTEISSTVKKRLEYTNKKIEKYIDICVQKEKTNQSARSDLIVDGVTIAKDLPATFLLGLETKLKEVRSVYAGIPTLQANIAFEKDENLGDSIYKTRYPEVAMKTQQVFKSQVLYEATDKHPAQIAVVNKMYIRGITKITGLSGRITVNRKSELLAKCDKIINACKQARQRANDVEHPTVVVGQKMFDYLMK